MGSGQFRHTAMAQVVAIGGVPAARIAQADYHVACQWKTSQVAVRECALGRITAADAAAAGAAGAASVRLGLSVLTEVVAVAGPADDVDAEEYE